MLLKEAFSFLLIGGLVAQEMIDNDQNTVSDGYRRSLRPSSFGNATILPSRDNTASDETLNERPELRGSVTRDCLCAFSLIIVCQHFHDCPGRHRPMRPCAPLSEIAAC